MHKLYDYICDELEELEQKATDKGLSGTDLEYIDKLTEIKKNILKIDMLEDEGYSAEYRDDMMVRDHMGGSYNRGGSYARGRGRNAKRDAMGRYSSERGYSRDGHELADELRDMMRDVTDERTRQKLQKFVTKIEEMA